mmetsp:Transcript_16994/g.39641  ORF Transcript_16994/g.39641 Transcript_16994/m.39641 type:complete len:405 (+) Transcript_16994:60-1274(+)
MALIQELKSFKQRVKTWGLQSRIARHAETQEPPRGRSQSASKPSGQASRRKNDTQSDRHEPTKPPVKGSKKVDCSASTCSDSEASTAETQSARSSDASSTSCWVPFVACGSEAATPRKEEQSGSPFAKPVASVERRSLKFDVGSQMMRGRKPWNQKETGQDVHVILPLGDGKIAIAVFDGHGADGFRASTFASQQFTQYFAEYCRMDFTEEEEVLREMFEKTQTAMRFKRWSRISGTTATVAILDPTRRTMSCAHVGDSRLALMSDEKVLFSTRDHSFDDPDEYGRAIATGGIVQECKGGTKRDIRRVCGLAISRTLGDVEAHMRGCSSVPEVHMNIPLQPGTRVVLASDGVWHGVDNEEALLYTQSSGSAKTAARNLLAEAYPRWLEKGTYIDDITTVVVQVA